MNTKRRLWMALQVPEVRKLKIFLVVILHLFCGFVHGQTNDKEMLSAPDKKDPYRLDQAFYFNKKIFFTAKTSTVQVQSYFYMNTKNGLTGYDADLAKQLGRDYSEMDFIVKLDDGNVFLYQTRKRNNEKIARIAREGLGFLPQYLEDANSTQYFKDYFEKNDEKTRVGDKSQYDSEYYQGVDMNGGGMFVLMSDNTDFNMNPDNKMLITSFFGLGYIYIEGSTKLITGWESDDYVARIERIEDVNFTFDGKRYKTYQQKANAEIENVEVHTKADFQREQEQLEQEERAQRSRTVTPENAERKVIDDKILQLKKQLQSKKENLTYKATGDAKQVSGKEGDFSTMYKKSQELMAGNDMVEIMQLELSIEKLKADKKVLSPAVSEEDRITAKNESACLQTKINLVNQLLEEYRAIDNKYPENGQQRFVQKMQLMNTRLMPALQIPCDK